MDTGRKRHPKPDGWVPEPTFPKGHRYEGQPRCQAWNPNKGAQCGRHPKKLLAGGHPADPEHYLRVCKWHGGDSPRGDSHYNMQGKGYSRYAPEPLQPTITAFLEQPDVLNLTQAVATWEGRISQLLESLDADGDPGLLLIEIRDQWKAMWDLTEAGQITQADVIRQSIEQLLKTGLDTAMVWDRVMKADDLRRKLVDTEDKRRDRARGFIRAEEARHHYNALRTAVVEGTQLISDPDTQASVRRFIAERFIQLSGPATLPGPPS